MVEALWPPPRAECLGTPVVQKYQFRQQLQSKYLYSMAGSLVGAQKLDPPPRLAVICIVRTTTRNGWASSGTGYLPEPSVKEPGPVGTKYSRLIQTPLLAGLLNAANCTISSGVSASAVRSWRVINWHVRSTCIKSLSSVLYNSCNPDTSSGKRITRPLCISLTVRRRSRRVVVRSWAASRPYRIILTDGGTWWPPCLKRAKAMGRIQQSWIKPMRFLLTVL